MRGGLASHLGVPVAGRDPIPHRRRPARRTPTADDPAGLRPERADATMRATHDERIVATLVDRIPRIDHVVSRPTGRPVRRWHAEGMPRSLGHEGPARRGSNVRNAQASSQA